MNIRYVISTMVFWWREHHLSFEQECDYLRNLGFGIEIWPTMRGQMDCRFAVRNWSRLKEATGEMTVALHSRDDGPNLNDWDEQLRCAAMLKAPLVTDLSSLCVSDKLGVADWGFVRDVVDMANQYGVMLCVENGDLEILVEMGDRFETIRYCFDTGHANLDSGAGYKAYVDALAEKTTFMHLTDNYGQFDDHEPPGVRGGIEKDYWDYLLRSLQKYDNNIIASLQMIPAMPGTLIRHSSKFLFDVMGWPNRPTPTPGYDENGYQPT